MTEGRRRVVIMGAAGRDFHNFNIAYRGDPGVEVVAFTATQIPGIEGRRYPVALAGDRYPDGIPILPEADLERVCREKEVDAVVFAYSDVTHDHVMHAASRALAAGADFTCLGPRRTMLAAARPVIAISAIRTGCGKSQTARHVASCLRARGVRVAVVRHPMPYGDLEAQRVQRFASLDDLDTAHCSNEEREEYEPHIAEGGVVFAGVDYAAILAAAESEADILLWDGGNNDFPFFRPDLSIVLADALRPGQAAAYHPGEATLRMADIIVVNKVDATDSRQVDAVVGEVARINPDAPIVRAASPVRLDDAATVAGKRVLVVEDGPTTTHGGQSHGAGYVAAMAAGAGEVVDPRASAPALVQDVYRRYPHIGPVLPAIGYSQAEREALQVTIARSAAEVVIVATPMDLSALVPADRPIVRVRYDFADAGPPTLNEFLEAFLKDHGLTDGREC